MKHMVFICFYVFLPWPSSIEITEQLKAKLEKRDLTSTCHPQEHLRLTTRRCDYDNLTTPSTPYCKCTKWIQMDQVQRSSWYIMVPQFHNSTIPLRSLNSPCTSTSSAHGPSGKAASNTRPASIWACTEALRSDTLGIDYQCWEYYGD